MPSVSTLRKTRLTVTVSSDVVSKIYPPKSKVVNDMFVSYIFSDFLTNPYENTYR